MKRTVALFFFFCISVVAVKAQDEEEKERGFKKENLFTGGSISLGFSNNTFSAGGNPVFGYSIANWLDAGVVVNYNYTSYRDFPGFDDKLRQSVYGGGGFMKVYPVRFIFLQGQLEHNIIRQKAIYANGVSPDIVKASSNSLLVGGGYTTSRFPGSGQPHFYLAVLFDVMNETYSPYTDAAGRVIPIFRAGIQVPLFQGRGGNRNRDDRY
jgi:hypothetical protein